MTDSPDDAERREQLWIRGYNTATTNAISKLAGDIIGDDPLKVIAGLLDERQRTINALRDACEEFGDNDWPDNLFLPDIIEKHLVSYLSNDA